MKKIFTLVVIAACGSLVSVAQQKPSSLPNYLQSENDCKANSSNASSVSAFRSESNHSSSQYLSNRGGIPTLWQEDFGGGFPNGWAVDDVSGISPWKWSMNGSHGYWNSSNQGDDYDDPINSTTASNGFLINDPDSANHFTYGQPSGTTYQYLESYFATTEIDLGGSYSSLLLEFEQSFRFNNTVDMIVMVSPDSTTWTEYTVQGSVNNNTASDDPDLVSVNISGAIGSSQTVFLKIGWSARVYFWMIDDMRIIEGLDNDLAMTEVWHGDIFNAYEFQKIPLSQTHEIVVGAACVNLGGTPQTNAIYTFDISEGGSSVASGTFPANTTSLGSTNRDTTWYATGFVPSEVGDYTVTISVASDQVDESLLNNEAESFFEMTEFIYAHDDEDNIEFQVAGGVDANNEANEYKIALYYPAFADMTMTSVQTAFGANTTTSTCIVEVYDAVNDQSLSNPIITEIYDLQPGDVSVGAVPTYVNILLDGGDGIQLTEGVTYLVSIGNTGVNEDLWFLASDGDDDRAGIRYGPFGAGGAIDWYTGYTTSPMIRVNTDPTVGIVDLSIAENGFGIYPNPATDQLTVKIDVDEEIQILSIVDMEGRLIRDLTSLVQSGTSELKVNLNGISPGVYFVTMVNASGAGAQKFILQ